MTAPVDSKIHTPLPAQEVVLPKRDWHEAYEVAFAEAKENGVPLSVIFVDLNNFGEVNDVLGHPGGDLVVDDATGLVGEVTSSLRTTPAEEEEQERPLDAVALGAVVLQPLPATAEHVPGIINAKGGRVGGDEFAIYAQTDAEGAKIIVERLRGIFNDYTDRPENAVLKELGVGAAIGTATMLAEDEDIDSSQLLRSADFAMYQDKRDQMPVLTEAQRRGLEAATMILKIMKIRLRDVPYYIDPKEIPKE